MKVPAESRKERVGIYGRLIIIDNSIRQSTMQAQQSGKQQQKGKKANNSGLLKYERPVYQLKKNQEGKVQGIISKLMQQQKQKPQIGFMPRSHLLQQLDSFLPVLKQSNQKLTTAEIQPEQRIDAKLEQLEDSSSSSQDEDEMVDESEKMETEKGPEVLESCDEFEFNIMTYPYIDKKSEQGKEEKETEQLRGKFAKVVEISGTGEKMEQLD